MHWDARSGENLYISIDGLPFLVLSGEIAPGYEISIDEHWIETKEQRFTTKFYLPLEPRHFTIKLFRKDRSFNAYRMTAVWKKYPSSMKKRITESSIRFDETIGYTGPRGRSDKEAGKSGFVQLYADGTPISLVDLDAQKHAKLSFRIFMPPDPAPSYDSWKLTIRNSANEVVGEIKKLGDPPPFFDWRLIADKIFTHDTYSYELDLQEGDRIFRGAANEFETIEGLSLLDHPYLPLIQFEPREEIGFYSYSDAQQKFSSLYVGGDLPIVIANRLIVHGSGFITLHDLNSDNSLTYIRAGAGIRLYGSGEDEYFGYPHIYRLDLTLNYGGYTIYPDAAINRFAQGSAMIESHFVLWAYQYIVPWFEYGATPRFDTDRISFGLNYYFFIRPWSVKLGLGFAYDKMLRFDNNPSLNFTVMRTMANFIFFL